MNLEKIKLGVAGTLNYLQVGLEHLKDNGYIPKLIIDDNSKIISHKEKILDNGLELLVCLAHPNILKKEEIELFPKGCINLHSGLPKYRGRHSINWMLIDGIKEIPVSVHYIDVGVDTGDIIVQDTILREREEDYNSMIKKITTLEKDLLLTAVKQIESNSVYRCKQHKSLLGYTPRRTPEDSRIKWNKTSEELHHFINALVSPMPNAFAHTEDDQEIKFQRSYIGKKVGEVLAKTNDNNYVISTKEGVILTKIDKELKIGDKFKLGED